VRRLLRRRVGAGRGPSLASPGERPAAAGQQGWRREPAGEPWAPPRDGQSLREQIAWACRILALEGYADLTLGHVSARGADGEVWIKRKGVALDEVEPEDVVAIDDTDAVLHLETVLHTGVYAARPDVGAVVHGHPPHATALASTDAELSLLTHDAILFADGLPRFDDPDLVVEEEQGSRVAAALGTHRALLLSNHGVLVVGKDVPWAVLTAVTLERAARLQAIASAVGELRPIDRATALQLATAKYRDEFVAEYWAAWRRSLGRASGGPGGDRA
jgi:L-fuculose-phosphate aldolase